SIASYNPMAKPHLLEKITHLKELQAEKLVSETLQQLNSALKLSSSERIIKVAINIADDLEGGWTNRYSTDFDNKFKINGLISRNFCTPILWSSENYTKELIIERTRTYAYRSLFWLNRGSRLISLEDHLAQEVFVAQKRNASLSFAPQDILGLKLFYEQHSKTELYSIIFNFFYGDEAAQALGYPTYGIGNLKGFDYVTYLANI
ncbi:MAG: hypothetical protein AAGJ93_14605, partial [Bacteroidota bacterium]